MSLGADVGGCLRTDLVGVSRVKHLGDLGPEELDLGAAGLNDLDLGSAVSWLTLV